jgi:hypothetical protein
MATALKLRRGTAAEHATFTGAQGEVTVVTDDYSLRVHDGVTAGGVPISGSGGGGAIEDVFYQSAQTLTANVTITANYNAMATGPIAIDDGVTLTIPDGSRVVIL